MKRSDQSISFENVFAAREIGLEDIWTSHKLNLETKKVNTIGLSISERNKILESVSSYTLSDDVKSFIKRYDGVFGKRDNFLWKWLGALYRESGVTLSTVDLKHLDSVVDDKIILTMLFSILDDVSEYYKDAELMEALLEIPNNNIDSSIIKKNEKLLFFKNLWDYLLGKLTKYPRYEEFKDIFWYDFNQMKNSVYFSFLVNKRPELINLHEMEIYDCHNMIVFLLNGIDLMVSPEFDKKDLPHLRTVFWHAQQMARIGNWLSTWKREIKEKDLCSGVIGYALSNKILSINDLKQLNEDDVIQKIEDSGAYQYFDSSWKQNYEKIKCMKDTIKSIDMDNYITGLENVFKFHMASEGLK